MTEELTTLPEPPLFRGDSRLVDVPATPTPETMLQAFIDSGADADRIREMTAIYKEWKQMLAEKAYAVALRACQQEMPTVVRDAKNSQTNSKYPRLETVQHVTKPIYSKYFALSFGEADCPLPNHKRTICDVTHDEGHTKQYHIDLPIDGIGPKGNPIGGMNAVQGSVSTTSYGIRRLICMIFNITVADEDVDGQRIGEPITQEQVAILDEWLTNTNTPAGRFLKVFGVQNLADFPASRFDEAIGHFKRKEAKIRQEAK